MVHKFRKFSQNFLLLALGLLFLVIFALTVPVAIQVWNSIGGGVVSANPVCTKNQPVPSRHVRTGKCQCMPVQESSGQWVPDSSCGDPGLSTPTVALSATMPLPSPSPSSTFTPTQRLSTVNPSLVPEKVPSIEPSGKGITPVVIHKAPLTCDLCLVENRKADAMSTLAAVEVTRLSLELTPRPNP